MTAKGKLIIDSSEQSADLLYATSFFVPDPCIYLEYQGEKTLVLSDLEVERGRKEASVDEVISLSDLACKIQKRNKKWHLGHIALELLKEKKCFHVQVSARFPSFYGFFLRRRGIKIEVVPSILYRERLQKTREEEKKIHQTIKAAEKGMRRALELIAEAKVYGDHLCFNGKPLTSESIRKEVELTCLRENALALHTIVASGSQAADPHQIGRGPLKAHSPVIIDIFPRSLSHFYFADLTRTVIKGKPREEVVKMAKAVMEAQKRAIEKIQAGVKASEVDRVARETLARFGFKTERRKGRPVGFIHSTGHGVGLEIHEEPRLGSGEDLLQENMVVTVEPGLYYPELGGVRYEDMIWVKKDGAKVMTKVPKTVMLE